VSDLGGDFEEDMVEDVSHAGGRSHCGGGEGRVVEEGGGETGSRHGDGELLRRKLEVGGVRRKQLFLSVENDESPKLLSRRLQSNFHNVDSAFSLFFVS
jgi:hypothetical protein